MKKANIKNLDKLISLNPEISAQNGQQISFKDYLDNAIVAFGLEAKDYHSAFYVLTNIADGQDAKSVVEEVKNKKRSKRK